MQKNIIKFLLLIIAFTFALSANYIFAVWTGPTQTPPGGNTPTPIHIGAVDQVKDAGLSLNSLAVFGNGFFDGNVGIGTTNPSAGGEQNLKLDVEGAIGAKFYCDENGNNCASAPLGGGIPNGMKVYDAPGSYTFNPAVDCNGCARIMVEVWGGGGGGGGGNDSPYNIGGGGGGGGYGKSIFTITPSTIYPVVVGKGGHSANGYNGVAEDGMDSSFGSSTLIYATGGKGAILVKTGGAGGTSNGMINITGGYGRVGGNSWIPSGGAAGGGGGPGGAGGSDAWVMNATPGSAPGGGGGAAGSGGTLPAEGASGRVIIYW